MPGDNGEWQPIWTRGGVIKEIVWIGKDVLAWCSGLYIVFFHVCQKRESLRWCSKAENTEGVCCLSGHPTMDLFAFSDKAPRDSIIRIFLYPAMRSISKCVGGSENGYLATAFTPTDKLISLGTHPTYSLIVWSWRSGEHLAMISTSIRDPEDQIIRLTHSKSTFVAQLGRPSGQLHIWEMSPAGKTIILTNHVVKLPKDAIAHHASWSPETGEPLLVVVDRLGNIYISNQDGSSVNRIVLVQRCGICLEYEAPSVNWFRDGIVLRTTFCQIRFFKKDSNNVWRKQWYVKSSLKPGILSVHPLKNDRLLYHTQEGYLMELNVVGEQVTPEIERRMHHGGIYSFVDMVHPWGHHVIAMDDPLEVAVLDCYDGRQVARLDLEMQGEAMQLLSHPDIPMAAVTSKKGELVVLSLRAPESPSVIANFNLQNERLDLIKFSESGRNLVVGQRTTGICYCISLTGNEPFAMIARVETKCRMADVSFYDEEGNLKLLVLVVSSRRIPVGRHLAVYELQDGKSGCTEPTRYLELPYGYQFLHYAPDVRHGLIGTAYLSRQIHLLEIKNWKQVNLVEAVTTGHQVRRARLFTDRRWIASAAFDGIITLRGSEMGNVIATLTSHHRKDFGAVKSIVQPSGNIFVALGHGGSLVAMKFHQQDKATSPVDPASCYRVDFGEYERKKQEIVADYESLDPDITEMLSKRVEGFPWSQDRANKTWVEWNEETMVEKEAEEYSQEKLALYADFEKLRQKVLALLENNKTRPEIERLPISAFDLDKVERDQRLKAVKDEIEDTRLELEHNCISMDAVASWIKSNFWEPQKIIGRSIFPIFGDEEVTNYSMANDTPEVEDMLQLARLYWDFEKNPVGEEPSCEPKLYTPSKLQTALSNQENLEETQRMDALLEDDDEEEHEIDRDEIEDQLAKEGMTTYRFLETSNHYSSQFDEYAFSQLLLDNESIRADCERLREFFNKLFEEMRGVKEREMMLIRERNERLRYIDSELRLLIGRSVSRTVVDPEWTSREMPEGIVRVLDDEVKVKPYLSASQRELLRREAAKAEELRRLLLADDFRERALMKMMDGVLEVRWEDVIKKDVPKPQCMLTKDPEDYNVDDLLAVARYHKDVDHLNQERQRYRKLLEAEFMKIVNMVQDGVEKFNAKLQDLLLLRMRVESALQQLNLRSLRGWLRHVYRAKAMREDDQVRMKIAEKQKIFDGYAEEVRLLRILLQGSKDQYEAQLTKERTSEKKIRSDFPSLRRMFVETMEKEYKRRPRILLKNATTSDLVELAKNVASHNRASLLIHECSEYLKHLDILDMRPLTLPPVVENYHWEHLVRIRRHRIEAEINIKAQLNEIRETERTLTERIDKIGRCNTEIDLLKEQLKRMKQGRKNLDLDPEIQLILKMGQVEVHASGRRDDSANAVFIPREEIDAANETIIKAGRKKLTTMNRTINFRRGIIFKEWEHKCCRMTIAELSEELSMVEKLLATRDIREYMKRQSMGFKDDKTNQQLLKELGMMKKGCEKRLNEWLVRLEDVEEKITKIKAENERVDAKIEKMNVDRWELEWQRDLDGEARQKEYHGRRMAVVVKRSKLVRALQKEYAELLLMQTEHELLRQQRFPTLSCYKTLDDET